MAYFLWDEMKLYAKTAILIGGVFMVFTLAALPLLYLSENRYIEAEGLAQAEMLDRAVFETLYASMRHDGDRESNRAVVERLRRIEGIHELRLIHGPSVDQQFGIEPDEQPQDDLDHRALTGEKVHEVLLHDGVRVARYVTPVFVEAECQACHQAEVGEVIGAISVHVSLEASDRALAARRNALLVWVVAALLGFGLVTFWGVQRLVVRPLQRIRDGAAALAAGDFEHRLGIAGGDEVGALAHAFNVMAARMQASHEHLEDQVHERTGALLALNQAALTMTAELEPDRVLQVITDLARELVGATYAALSVPGEDGRIVELFTAGLTEEERAAIGDLPRGWGMGMLGHLLREGEPLRLDDLRQHPQATGFPSHHPAMTSFLGVPIVSRGRVLGGLYLADKVSKKTSEVSQTSGVSAAAEPFTPEDQQVIETMAAQAAVAIENSRLYEAERRRRETASALLEIAEIVSSTLDYIPLLKRLALRTAQVCRVNRCTIFLLDEAGERLQPIMAQFADEHTDPELWQTFKGTTADYVDIVPLFRQAIRERRPAVLEDSARTDLISRKWTRPFGIQKLLVVPLVRHDQAIGLMALDYTDAAQEFNQGQIDLAMTIGSQVAASIENAQLHEETRRLSLTDELTGLANRRAFDARLAEEIRRARRYDRPLALIMADIDHFKHYNDTYGHPQGDVLLQELAGVLRSAVRETDFVARYGGEEFAVILPETDKAGALWVAEKVRAAVAAHPFPRRESQPGGRLTISMGVATFPEDLPEPVDLVQRADQVLYRAKREGRNRVCTP